MIRIKAVGDLMPGGILNKREVQFVSHDVTDYLYDADIRVGTLECAIGNEPNFCAIKKGKGSSAFVYAEDKDLIRLKKLNINVVTLANNHFFDLGESGAEHTLKLLDQFGILHCGAGMNLQEAQKPAVINIRGKKVAFIGFCDKVDKYCRYATSNTPGLNPLEKNNIIKSVEDARKKYDYVFAMVHWGKEHTWWPSSHVIRYAEILQKAGISGIIGSHPHRIQSVCKIKNCNVAYSLGNFLFPDRIINTPYVTYYPLNICNIGNLKKVLGFTKVQEPSLKLWPEIANIGMILDINCKKQFDDITMDYKLTQIDRSGYIEFMSNPNEILFKLAINKLFISNILYPYLFNICHMLNIFFKRCISKLNRMLKRKS